MRAKHSALILRISCLGASYSSVISGGRESQYTLPLLTSHQKMFARSRSFSPVMTGRNGAVCFPRFLEDRSTYRCRHLRVSQPSTPLALPPAPLGHREELPPGISKPLGSEYLRCLSICRLSLALTYSSESGRGSERMLSGFGHFSHRISSYLFATN